MATNNAVNTSLSGQTGTGTFVGSTSPTLVTPALGTPASGVLTNCTGLPVGTGLATATNSAVLVSGSTGTPVWSSTMTNGQVVVGSTGATPTAATLTAGTGISITNGAGSITINAVGLGETWTTVTGTSQAAAVNNGYITNNAGVVTVTLPATAAIGSAVTVVGLGAGGWTLAANAGQTIQFGNLATTTAGSFSSTNQFDTIEVVCMVANTTWTVISAVSAGLTKA